MASSLRELRERRRSVQTTRKITRAMEMVAASRIIRAQQAAKAAVPYSTELTRAVSALTSAGPSIEHPLLVDVERPLRSAMLLITSDRGLAGAYTSNAIKAAEQLHAKLIGEGQEVVQYLTGNKGLAYFEFRERHIEQSWTGFSERPEFKHAREIAKVLLDKFLQPTEEGGVDQIHIVTTRFESMVTQRVVARRLLPLVVQDAEIAPPEEENPGIHPFYDFEPNPKDVLDQLLPMFVTNRVHTALLMSAASELANRQRAMKSATDNADALIEQLTREANQARQSEITQEITEIVGGAAALSETA